MESKYVVVETTAGLIQAQIIKSLLESREIPALLSHESAATVFSVSVGPLAEVDILVPAAMETQARMLIDEFHSGNLQVDDDPAATGT
jgi:hypothetical protein